MVVAVPNPNASKTYYKHATTYLGSSSGNSKVLSLGKKVLQLVNTVGNKYPALIEAEKTLNVGATVPMITALPFLTTSAAISVKEVCFAKKELAKKTITAVRNTSLTAGCWASTVLLFTKNALMKSILMPAFFVADAADLYLNGRHYQKLTQLNEPADAPAEVKQTIEQSKKHKIMQIAANVAGIALVVLGLVLNVPATILILASIALGVLKISTTLYEETRPYKMLEI